MDSLLNQLKKVVETNLNTNVIISTISELRKIYKPQNEQIKSKNVMYHIFNSVWNRIPNFDIPNVLKDKLDYAFRIGIGMASYNQLPLSWIMCKMWKGKNFLMKDRGHITTLVCSMYEKQYGIKIFLDVIENLIKKYKRVGNWKDDYNISNAIPILDNIKTYLTNTLNSYMEKYL
mgnify:CR=1 FL=1